jgi:ABC-type spermidine/putrescine transport system permease subunit I
VDKSTAALALATVGLVPAVYAVAMPPMADCRAQADDRGHLAAGERYAAIVSGAVVLGVAGATRSPAAALAGLVAVIGFASAYRYATRAQP